MGQKKGFIFRKIKLLMSLNIDKIMHLLEAYAFLAWARILKQIPFSKLAPTLGTYMSETTTIDTPSHRDILRTISEAIRISSRNTFWESMCLVKAIAGMKMLKRRGIESTLYLGTAKDNSGNLIAHAWLRSGSYFISGAEEMDKFTVVAKFANSPNAKNMRQIL